MTQLPPLPACLFGFEAESFECTTQQPTSTITAPARFRCQPQQNCWMHHPRIVQCTVSQYEMPCLSCKESNFSSSATSEDMLLQHTHTHTHTQELHIIQNHHTVPFCDMNVFLLMCVCCMCPGAIKQLCSSRYLQLAAHTSSSWSPAISLALAPSSTRLPLSPPFLGFSPYQK